MIQSQKLDDLSTDARAIGSHQWEASYEYVVNGLDIFDWRCRDCGMKARMTFPTEPESERPRPPFDPAAVRLMAGGMGSEELLGAARHYFGHDELSKMTCSEAVAELVHHPRAKGR